MGLGRGEASDSFVYPSPRPRLVVRDAARNRVFDAKGEETMNKLVTGRLLGIEETKLSLETGSGKQVFPRKDLDVSVQWVFAHLERPVICQLQDGVVVKVESLR